LAIGANVTQANFHRGARRAQAQFARAGYDANVASYRQNRAYRISGVQDEITGAGGFDSTQQTQQQAVDSARRTLDISTAVTAEAWLVTWT